MKLLANRLSFYLVALAIGISNGVALAAEHTARLTASPAEYHGQCPARIEFRGTITAARAGNVQYRFIRSDGALAPIKTINFDSPGSKQVTTSWTLGGTSLPRYDGWQAIKIVYPRRVESNHANFSVRCAQAGLPDLRLQLRGPQTAQAGADITDIQVRVKNGGSKLARGTQSANRNGYMVDLVLSKDTRVPDGFATYSDSYREDVLLKGGRISNTRDVAAGESTDYTLGAGIPANTPGGRYYLCGRVDAGNKIAEADENNNTACRLIRVTESRPVTHRTGRLEIRQTYLADLDNGTTSGPRDQADIWFQAKTATRRFITPRNGAKIGIAGNQSIGKSGCSTLPTSGNSLIPLSSVPVGTYVCVKTNQGRIAQFRVNESVGPSPGTLKIGYTTWKR